VCKSNKNVKKKKDLVTHYCVNASRNVNLSVALCV